MGPSRVFPSRQNCAMSHLFSCDPQHELPLPLCSSSVLLYYSVLFPICPGRSGLELPAIADMLQRCVGSTLVKPTNHFSPAAVNLYPFHIQSINLVCAKVKCSGQKAGCDRCAELALHCKYEISMVGKVPGMRSRVRRRSAQPTHDGADQTVAESVQALSPSPPTFTGDTVMVATTRSPKPLPAGTSTQSESYGSLARTPSPFTSTNEDDCFKLLSGTDLDFISLSDVDIRLGDQGLADAVSGVSEQSQGQWYTLPHSSSAVHANHREAFDTADMAFSNSQWATSEATVHSPIYNSTIPVQTIPTPAALLPSECSQSGSQAVRMQHVSDRRDSHDEKIEQMLACGEIIRTLVIKETAKMDPLDIILNDYKKHITRLGAIIRDDEFDRSTACRSMVCTAFNLVLGQLERCVVVDAPAQPADIDSGPQHIMSPQSSCTASNISSESGFTQKPSFSCPLPNISFGALQFHGTEQLVFCNNLVQTEVSRGLRLVSLLQQRQSGNRKFQANISAAKIQELWCKDFTIRMRNLLRHLGQDRTYEV